MSQDLVPEIKDLIRPYFAFIAKKFNEAIPHSYTQFIKRNEQHSITGNFGFLPNHVNQVVAKNFDYILNEAALLVSDYLHVYGVQPSTSICEYKQIYFTGRAIEKALLQPANHPTGDWCTKLDAAAIAKIHMYTLVGLLHYLNETNDEGRPQMASALVELIDKGLYASHLGKYGGYLLFKCQGSLPNDLEEDS